MKNPNPRLKMEYRNRLWMLKEQKSFLGFGYWKTIFTTPFLESIEIEIKNRCANNG